MGSSEDLESTAVGYNESACQEINEGLEFIYSATVSAIVTEIQKDILMEVGKNWYAENAVSYFEQFATNCKNASDDVCLVFKNFRNQMQSDIDAWRKQTGNPSTLQLEDITQKDIEIDYANWIKSTDSDGNRYISNTLETDVTGWVDTCRKDISDDIGNAISLRTVGSFIGGGQNKAINESIEGLAGVIDGILNFLTMGENSIINAITDYRGQYTSTAETVTTETSGNKYDEGVNTQGGADDITPGTTGISGN